MTVPYSHLNNRSLLNFSLHGNPKWDNKVVKELRINLIASNGQTSIYNIYANNSKDTDSDGTSDINELSNCRNYFSATDFGINFDLPNEAANTLQNSQITNFNTINGILTGTATGIDPIFYLNSIKFKGEEVPKIKMRIKASTTSTAQIFWKNEDGGYSGQRVASANITAANTWQEIIFDMSTNPNWIGKTISDLRIDPILFAPNQSFEIDWIRSFTYQDCSTSCQPLSVALPQTTIDNWTYYALPSSTNYLFGIEHKPLGGNTADFTASIIVNKLCSPAPIVYSKTSLPNQSGVFISGYYLNFSLNQGSLNGFVNFRFFPLTQYHTSMELDASTFASTNQLNYQSPSIYFRTKNTLNLPSDIRLNGEGINFSFYPTMVNSSGIFFEKNYVQFNQISDLNQSGLGYMRSVTNLTRSALIDPNLIKGAMRYNNVLDRFEGFNGLEWVPLHK